MRRTPMDEKPAKPTKERSTAFDRMVVHYLVALFAVLCVYGSLYSIIQDQRREIARLNEQQLEWNKRTATSIDLIGQAASQAQRVQITQTALTELDKQALGCWMKRQIEYVRTMTQPRAGNDDWITGDARIRSKDYDAAERAIAEEGHTPATVATGGKINVARNK
jgi:hypothetical protein